MKTARTYAIAAAMVAAALVGIATPSAAAENCTPGAPERTNDCFADAAHLEGPWPKRFSAVTDGALAETGEPLQCGASANTVWFEFVASANGVATLTRVPVRGEVPSVVSAFTGDAVDALAFHGCGTYGTADAQELSIECEAGVTYKLQVAATSGTNTGMSLYDLSDCIEPSVLEQEEVGASAQDSDSACAPAGNVCASHEADASARTGGPAAPLARETAVSGAAGATAPGLVPVETQPVGLVVGPIGGSIAGGIMLGPAGSATFAAVQPPLPPEPSEAWVQAVSAWAASGPVSVEPDVPLLGGDPTDG